MRDLFQDVRYGIRVLARSRTFSLVVVLSLALGIGVNTTIFSLVSAVLFRPPAAVREPDRLVWMFQTMAGERHGEMMFSYPDFTDVRSRREVFSGVLAYLNTPLHVAAAGSGEGEPVTAQLVTG